MRPLVFIYDDQTELDNFGDIVKGEYDYTAVHWPAPLAKFSTKLNVENVENFWAGLVNIFSRGEMVASVLHGEPRSRSD